MIENGLFGVIVSLREQLAKKDAEIARLKTVPMKYRRMAFNAQLQDENEELRQQLADIKQNINTLAREQAIKMVENGTGTYWKEIAVQLAAIAAARKEQHHD